MPLEPTVSVRSVSKVFGRDSEHVEVLRDVSLTASLGEVVVIRGPNGVGKSTLLNILAGVDSPTVGSVYVARDGARSLGYVFQNYSSSLLPWLTLRENLLLPLRFEQLPAATQKRRVEQLRDNYSLAGVPLDRYPREASGGQKQRVCIAGAALCSSAVVLMDEPFSSLDERGHVDLASLIEQLRGSGRLLIVVVHDLDDAILIADRVLLLDGTPASILQQFAIQLPRPRKFEYCLIPAFAAVRASILGLSHAS